MIRPDALLVVGRTRPRRAAARSCARCGWLEAHLSGACERTRTVARTSLRPDLRDRWTPCAHRGDRTAKGEGVSSSTCKAQSARIKVAKPEMADNGVTNSNTRPLGRSATGSPATYPQLVWFGRARPAKRTSFPTSSRPVCRPAGCGSGEGGSLRSPPSLGVEQRCGAEPHGYPPAQGRWAAGGGSHRFPRRGFGYNRAFSTPDGTPR